MVSSAKSSCENNGDEIFFCLDICKNILSCRGVYSSTAETTLPNSLSNLFQVVSFPVFRTLLMFVMNPSPRSGAIHSRVKSGLKAPYTPRDV